MPKSFAALINFSVRRGLADQLRSPEEGLDATEALLDAAHAGPALPPAEVIADIGDAAMEPRATATPTVPDLNETRGLTNLLKPRGEAHYLVRLGDGGTVQLKVASKSFLRKLELAHAWNHFHYLA